MTTTGADMLKTGPNPFENAFIRTPWDRTFVDVPSINSRASDIVARKIAETRESGESQGVLLLGEPGFGKSHLLARLRNQPDPGKVLTFVEPPRSPDRVLRHLLREAIVRLGTTQVTELTQLEQLAYDYVLGLVHEGVVENHLVAPGIVEVVRKAAEELIDLATLHAAIRPELQSIQDYALARDPELDPEVLRAFLFLVHECRNLRILAMRWLRGDVLSQDDLDRLGLQSSEESTVAGEERAHRALRQLLKICHATNAVLVLCVDQIEEVNDGPGASGTGIRALGEVLSNLIQYESSLLVITACLRDRWEVFVGEHLNKSQVDRIAQTTINLKPLVSDEVHDLIQTRLDVWGQQQRVRVRTDEVFDVPALDQWVAREVIVHPRLVLQHCGEQVELLREGVATLPLGTKSIKAVPVSDALKQKVDEARLLRRQIKTLEPTSPGIMVDGEPRLSPPLAAQERDAMTPALSLDPIGWYFGLFEETVRELEADPARELPNVDEQDLTATVFEVLQVLARRRVCIADARVSTVALGGYVEGGRYDANSLRVTLERMEKEETRGIVFSSADHFQSIRTLLERSLEAMQTTPGFFIRTVALRNTYRKSREIMQKMPLGAAFIMERSDYLALIAVQRLRHAASAGDLTMGPKLMRREDLDGLMIQSGVLEDNRIVRTAYQMAPRPVRSLAKT